MAATPGHADDRAVRRAASGSIESASSRPWRVFKSTDGRKLIGIGDEDGGGILDAGFGVWSWNHAEGIANAELAVRAVNSHDDILAALKLAVGHIEHMAAFFGGKGLGYSFESLGEDVPGIRAAIAKAEGLS